MIGRHHIALRIAAAVAAVAAAGAGCSGVDRYELGDEPVPTTVAVDLTDPVVASTPEAVRAAAEVVAGASAPRPQASGEPAAEDESSQTGQITHEIVPGDILYDLASRYGTTVDAIVEANQLADPAGVPLGTVLIIPTSS